MSLSERLKLVGAGQYTGYLSAPTLRQVAFQAKSTDAGADLREEVSQELLSLLGPNLYSGQLTQEALSGRILEAISLVLRKSNRPLSADDRAALVQQVTDDLIGNGPLETLLRDPEVSEILVNGPDQIFVEIRGQLYPSDVRFKDEDHLRRIIERICARVGRRIDEASPLVDARLPDGSRVNAVIPPIAIDGSTLSIRKFGSDVLTAADLVAAATMTESLAAFLDAAVRAKFNILISGGTGAGKTTTLNVLSSFMPATERIVTIEDSAELQLNQPHVVRLESRPSNVEGQGLVTIRDLVKNALRMRPDRIVVGEIRDGAALDMLQAMNTGHAGSLTTVHANSARDAISRLETMVLMAGMDLPMRAIRDQASQAIDLVVQQSRMRDGSRRITEVVEVIGIDGDEIVTRKLFDFDFAPEESEQIGELRALGYLPTRIDKFAAAGVSVSDDWFGVSASGRNRRSR